MESDEPKEPAGRREDADWSRLTAEEFLSGYGEGDAVHDEGRGVVTIPKEQVLKLIQQMPDEIDVEELIYRLYVMEKLALAEADIAAGRTYSSEELRAQAAEWGRKG